MQDKSVTLAWEAAGEYAAICPLMGSSTVGCRCLFDMPLVGSTTIKSEEIIGNYTGFELIVNAGDSSAVDAILANVQCQGSQDWYFADPPQMCPAGSPLHSSAAAQRFQRGLMIWIEALDEFFILFDSDQHPSDSTQGWSSLKSLHILRGSLELRPAASPGNRVDETPPPGYFEPVSGFGLVWRGEVTGTDDIREMLGWAEEPEYRFDTVYQCQASCGAYWDCYLRGPDGKAIHLYYLMHFGHYWEEWSGPLTPPSTPSPSTEAPAATAAPSGPAIVSFHWKSYGTRH